MCTKLENLWKIHAAAWESFRRRADHEFRFSVAVWTAAVALIALGLMEGLPLVPTWLAIAAPATFVFLHYWYERGMARSNDTDLNKCYALEDAIMTEIHFKWPEEVQRHINRRKQMDQGKLTKESCKHKISKNWSHIGHVGITAVLAFIVAYLLCTTPIQPADKMDKETPSSPDSHKMEPSGSNPQKLKALREAAPRPADGHGDEAALPQDITDLPNKTNAPFASGADFVKCLAPSRRARRNKALDPTARAGCPQASLLPSIVLAGQRRD